MIKINSYCTFHPLKSVILGKSLSKQHFSHITDPKITEPLWRVLDETEEDFQNFETVLKQHGVKVFRPDINADSTSATRIPKPPHQPRDDMVVVGKNLYVANPLKEYNEIFAQIDPNLINHPKDHLDMGAYPYTYADQHQQYPDQQKTLSSSFIHRLGRDIFWGTHRPGWRDHPFVQYYKNLWESQGFRVNLLANEGHGDCTWCILKPGVIVTLFDINNYKELFPGWDILYLEDKYWDQLSPFRSMKRKVAGRWWIQGEENNENLINYVETWLRDWVGYVEETVFEINMLSLDDSHVVVNNYNKEVFDFLKKHHIEPIICSQRHRWFWDGGVHCITQDLERAGGMDDYF